MKIIRNYQGKDVEMLTTCAVLVENAIANIEFLEEKRSNWNDNFFGVLKNKIDAIFADLIGMDTAAKQRKATQIVIKIQNVALEDLAELKVQIMGDFKANKPRRDEILKELGYTTFLKSARSRDQEALVQWLFRFRTNLSHEIHSEICNNGVNSDILDRILSYTGELFNANITQETLKNSRKAITQENVIQYNEIYGEVISFARMARNFYKGNPAKQDEFSYTKIRKRLNATPRTEAEGEELPY